MDAPALLKEQFTRACDLIQSVAADLTPPEWTMRPAPGQNLIGFTVWHLPATQDFMVHRWIRNVPEVREAEAWAKWPGMGVTRLPFGMTREEADAIAYATNLHDVLAYAAAVQAAIEPWFDTLTPDDLDRTVDARTHLAGNPVYQTLDFLVEAEEMWDEPMRKFLTGTCIGHVRGHVGEVALAKAVVRSRVQA